MSEQELIIEGEHLQYFENEKKHRLRGVVAKADNPSKNGGRVYPRVVLEAAVDAFMEKVRNGSAIATLDHEQSANVSLTVAAAKIERLWWDGNDLWAEMVCLEGTERGDILIALLKQGVRVGCSTRGSGPLKNGKVESLIISSIDVVHQPANTQGAMMDYVYENLAYNSTSNVDGLDDNPPGRGRTKMVKRIVSHINSTYRLKKNVKSHVIINPKTKNDESKQQAISPSARTQHPEKRGRQGMKETFPNTDGERYLSPDSKVPSTRGKPNHLKPRLSKKGMLEGVDADSLHESLGGVLKAVSMAVADNQLTKHSAIYRTAKAAFAGYKAYQNGKPIKNTNLPKSPTQVLSNKGTQNFPKTMKREAVELRTPEAEARDNLLLSWQSQDENKGVKQYNEMVERMIDAQTKLEGKF